MTSVRRLALASTIATFVLVTVGGLVRATRSGLGCGDDWPDCSGAVIPYFGNRAVIIEFSHRLLASVVVVLLAVLAITAWRRAGNDRRVRQAAAAAFALVLFQAVLGAVVVWLELTAGSVVLHLATAMTLLAVLIYLTLRASVADDALDLVADDTVARRAAFASAAVLVLLLVGSYVSGRDAGYVFPDWPLMDGALIPAISFEPALIHFLHRALAAVTGVIVITLGVGIVRRKEYLPQQARFAAYAMALFVVQVLVGATTVWNPPPGIVNELLVTGHLLIGALIWGCLVSISVISRPALAAAAPRGARATPVYEGGP